MFPSPQPMHHQGGDVVAWFGESCRRFPSDTSVEWRGRSVTYAELEKMICEIACRLDSYQLGRGALVAVLISDRIALIAAMIALFQRRCVFVPLDPDGPFEAIRGKGSVSAGKRRSVSRCPAILVRLSRS